MTNPAPISEALREILAKVPDEWSKWPRGVKAVQSDLLAAGLIQVARPYAKLHTTTVRRTAAGRALMEQKG